MSVTLNISYDAGFHGCHEKLRMKKKVLIVEDNELNMKLFHDLLDTHGFEILQTRNGLEALNLARTHRPDLILMDIQLPEVSGLEVTKWLKEDDTLKDIPVIAVTAFAMKGDEKRIREGGCEAYISKPISIKIFLDTINQFVGETSEATHILEEDLSRDTVAKGDQETTQKIAVGQTGLEHKKGEL